MGRSARMFVEIHLVIRGRNRRQKFLPRYRGKLRKADSKFNLNIMLRNRQHILLYILSAVLLLIGAGLLLVFIPSSESHRQSAIVRVEARSCYVLPLGRGDTLQMPLSPEYGSLIRSVAEEECARADLTGCFVSNAGHLLTSDSLVMNAPDALAPEETRSRLEHEDSLLARQNRIVGSELKELDYYARTHSVVDDGYNEVMSHREKLSRYAKRIDSVRSRLKHALQLKLLPAARLKVEARAFHAWHDDSGRVFVDTLPARLCAHDAADGLLLLKLDEGGLPQGAHRVALNWCGVGKEAVSLLAYADYGGRTAQLWPQRQVAGTVLPRSASEGGVWLSHQGHMRGLQVAGKVLPLHTVHHFLRECHAWPVWQWINLKAWCASFFTADAEKTSHRPLKNGTNRPCAYWHGKDGSTYCGQYAVANGRRRIRQGFGEWRDSLCVTYRGEWQADTLARGERLDADGYYSGTFNAQLKAEGTGTYLTEDGEWYEGNWADGQRSGHGYSVKAGNIVKCGSWRKNRFQGERMIYTSDRIYGIDISRYQHEDARYKRKTFPIEWDRLRITSLGSGRRVSGAVDYPVSYVYIKATQGTRISNKYYAADLRQARRHGIAVGSYHFYSSKYNGPQQAAWFLQMAWVAPNDLPPVLDLEPTEAEVREMGGEAAMFREVLKWLHIVEQRRGKKPVLYVGQQFVNQHLVNAPAELRNYDVWIARYGEFKPYVHLLHWQLTPYGRVRGIHGEVDINVFNGTKDHFKAYLSGQK